VTSLGAGIWAGVRNGWDRLAIYLPIILMGLMALGTYWLARNTPAVGPAETARAQSHEPDYFMRGFSVKSFDPTGRLKSELFGTEARHYPDSDTLEIDKPRMRAFNPLGELTVASAQRAISNSDGSEIQLIGDAVVTRDAVTQASGNIRPKLEIRGEFLHAFADTERLKSHKPVILVRGGDQFTAESLDYDNLDGVLDLRGRVRGLLMPRGQ
jgi:lipopolysaccharide export system protein LptC